MTIREHGEHGGLFVWHGSDLEDDPGIMLWPIMGLILAAMGASVFVLYLKYSVPLSLVGLGITIVLFLVLVAELLFTPPRARMAAVVSTFVAIPVWTCVWMIVIGVAAGALHPAYG